MGCGVSKFDKDVEIVVPVGLRPLHRRTEEIKRRRNDLATQKQNSTFSREQLLEDGGEDELSLDDFPHHDRRKSLESVGSTKGTSSMLESVNTAAAAEGKGREVEREEREEGEGEDEDEADRGFGDGEGSELGPGSPSFREYYLASVAKSLESSDTSKDDGKSERPKRKDKLRRNDSTVSLNSSEGSVTKFVKGEHRGRKFRKMLSKGGQSAIKNLLNVKSCSSCFTPHCSSHDNSRLLTDKLPTTPS